MFEWSLGIIDFLITAMIIAFVVEMLLNIFNR